MKLVITAAVLALGFTTGFTCSKNTPEAVTETTMAAPADAAAETTETTMPAETPAAEEATTTTMTK